MKNDILIKELIKREQALTVELDAIRLLIGVYSSGVMTDVNEGAKTVRIIDKDAKGKKDWNKYALFVLNKLGGKAKASEVIERVIELNPDIDKKKVRNAIVSKLSSLYRAEVIGAVIPDNQKEGYTYFIKEKEPDGSNNIEKG